MEEAAKRWRIPFSHHSVWGLCIQILLTLAAVVAGVVILTTPQALGAGVRQGLDICYSVVIPSLFPFMVLAGFIVRSSAGDLLAKVFAPVLGRLFRLPKVLCGAALMSFIGGYPMGASMIKELLRQRRVDTETAGRMLTFCVNPGPTFVVTAVGISILGSAKAGGLLLLGVTLASLLTGWIFSLVDSRNAGDNQPTAKPLPYSSAGVAFVDAVLAANGGILAICAFVVLFSGLGALLEAVGAFAVLSNTAGTLLRGGLEVVSGCVAAGGLGTSYWVLPFLLGFAGCSVIGQVMATLAGQGVPFRAFILSRFVHGGLSAGICSILFRLFPQAVAAFVPVQPPFFILAPDSKTVALTLCFLGLSTLLMFAVMKCLIIPKKP